MTPLLEALRLSRPGRLHPVDLRIDGAQLVCVVGPNGSGKTSLLHAVAGLGDGTGTVRVMGEDPRSLPPDRRKRLLAYLPAARDAAWPLRARDLVRLGLPSRAAAKEADDALAGLDLAAFANRRVDRLSTGERSRVLIARALVARPALLLLDEPTANLDPLWQLRLMARLRDAVAGGQAAVVAMHDLDLAARFADRLVLMHQGKCVADGAPSDIIASRELREAFGIERVEGRWRELSPTEDPRSSR